MTSTRSLMAALGACLAVAPTAAAQYPLLTPEQKHQRMSLSSADHAATHSRLMSKLQAKLDTALNHSYLLEKRIKAMLAQNQEEAAGRPAVVFQMTQNVSAITEALHAMASGLGSLMDDGSTVRDRSLQEEMEEIQLALGAIAAESRSLLTTLETTARRAPPARP